MSHKCFGDHIFEITKNNTSRLISNGAGILLRVFVRIKIGFNRVILSKTRGNSGLTESYPLLFRSLHEPWRKTTKLTTK